MKRTLAALAAAGAALAFAAAGSAAPDNAYTMHPLVSNGGVPAPTIDPKLVNAWGLTAGPTTPFWVADNGTGLSTLYSGTGVPNAAIVVPVGDAPTGDVFNGSSSFVVSGTGQPARFIFDSEAGEIHAWNLAVSPPSHPATLEVAQPGAEFKGLAIATTATGPRLYATDFAQNRVDVYDGSWNLISVPGMFVDPMLPADYAPFGIQTIGSRIFVTYAEKASPDATDETAGQGRGFVDAYDTDGNLLARVAQHGQLNAPWGLAWAPSNFGRFSGDLLVGNFGDGQINAFEELPSGQFVHRGELRTGDGRSLTIDGLWALQFGSGIATAPSNTLFFTAGPNDEADGLFGSITSG